MRYLALFFNSYPGMYMAQSFCHSLTAAVLAEQAMKAWKIHDPSVRQRFRILVILLPVFSFPLYQIISPSRGSVQFRLDALFDVNRWLLLEIRGLFPAGVLFLALLACTALVFLFQELIPVFRHTLRSSVAEPEGTLRPPDAFIVKTSAELHIEQPDIFMLDEDEPLLFSATGRKPAISVSRGLADSLTPGQFEAALAHEMAHIARNKRPVLIAVFILRMIMFFNPVVLIKFRRAVRDEEKICDDMAVVLTGNPRALADALRKFYQKPARLPDIDRQNLPAFTSALEEQSHNLHLQSRITRLEQSPEENLRGGIPLVLTLLAAGVLNYFIV